ncbi:MAG TPA: hypothetical protein VGA70_12620 [Longimicrobiales bacterium]|jgi:hypothetical protein
METTSKRGVIVLSLLLAAGACADPPAEAIALAAEAREAALAAGAEEYAPEALNQVAEARAAMEAELAVQSERWAVRRAYGRAQELADTYRVAAEQAEAAAGAAREQVRQEATDLLALARQALTEARDALAVAPVGKGSRADVEALIADLDTAAQGLDDADAALAAERYLEARSMVSAAREIIDRVGAAVAQARDLRAG